MPLFLVVIPPSFRVWRLLLWLHNKLNAFTRVAHKTSEQPKKHTDGQDDCFLSSSELPKKDIDKRDHATSYAQIEPPQDPMVNPKMKIHIPFFHFQSGAMINSSKTREMIPLPPANLYVQS